MSFAVSNLPIQPMQMPVGQPALGGSHAAMPSGQTGASPVDGVSLSDEAAEMMGSRDHEQSLFRQLSGDIESGDTQAAHDIVGTLQGMCSISPPGANLNDPSAMFDGINNSLRAGDDSTAQQTIKQIEGSLHL